MSKNRNRSGNNQNRKDDTGNDEKRVNINADAIFVCREKGSHLLFNAYKIKIKNGIVVDVKQLTRAGDMFRIAVNSAASELWGGKLTSTDKVFNINENQRNEP